VLTRTGTTAAAIHAGPITLSTGVERRLVIEDAEPTTTANGQGTVVAYREVVDIPAGW
jgi:hypothetical protein